MRFWAGQGGSDGASTSGEETTTGHFVEDLSEATGQKLEYNDPCKYIDFEEKNEIVLICLYIGSGFNNLDRRIINLIYILGSVHEGINRPSTEATSNVL